MPLIVPLLRLSMLFLNVYDTFKTLKPPALSARTGRVSVRAASQRKRDMKGVLAIWIVWACFATYERTVDGMIRFFIPFYDEIKSLLILFLIVSRSRGAEPIYLHVIRPLVKPYVVTLDALLDVVHGVGDLLLLAGRIPIQVVSSWWHERLGFREAGAHATGHERAPDPPAPPEPASRPSVSSQSSASSIRGQTVSAPQVPRSAFSDANPGQTSSMRAPPAYEIWHPPPPAYEDSMASEAPSHASTTSGLPASSLADETWRQYPAFPSAYPVTPAPPQPKLPPLAHAPPSISTLFPVVPEQETPSQPESSKTRTSRNHPQAVAVPEWDFERSLQSRPEQSNPSSVSDWSDNDEMTGVQTGDTNAGEVVEGEEVAMAVDSSEEEIEDDFDVTLRTPPARPPRRRRVVPSIHIDEVLRPVSIAIDSRSTSLTTVGNRLSALPSTTEESGASGTENAPPPILAGAKRPLPRAERADMAKRGRTVATANKRAPLTRARKAAASPAFQMTYSGDASGEQTTEEQDRASADRRPKRQLAITDTRTAERATRGPARARQSAVGASKGGRGQDRPTRTAVPPRTGGARASTQASRPRT